MKFRTDNAELVTSPLATEICSVDAGTAISAPQWVQLLPVSSGECAGQDGRRFVVKDLAAVIAATKARWPGGICLDINHGTDLAGKEGHAAPAAAWIKDLAAHGPNNEPGLWGQVSWTPGGKRAVEDGEYRYLSPAIVTNKNTRQVVRIERCTLTNDPALDIKSLFHTQPENNDVKLNKDLCAALGIAEDADEATAIKAATALKASAANLVLLAAAGGVAEKTEINDTVVTALCAKLKTPAATGDAAKLQGEVDTLRIELNSLKLGRSADTAKLVVEQAITDGKLVPANKDWGIDYCARDPEGFAKFIAAQPRVIGDVVVSEAKLGALSVEETDLCAMTGVKPEDFIKTRDAMKAAQKANA